MGYSSLALEEITKKISQIMRVASVKMVKLSRTSPLQKFLLEKILNQLFLLSEFRGWVFRDELLAPWESNLPAVLSIIPDTTVEVVYHDDNRTTREGFVLPIKRASVEFQYTSRLTHELIMLDFVNVDFIYSTTNNNDSHFILEGIVKKIKLKDTRISSISLI